MEKNIIALRRKNAIVEAIGPVKIEAYPVVGAAIQNILAMGYMPSESFVQTMLANPDTVSSIVSCLKNMIGANFKYRPFYPNFPKQVMEASDAELFINAMVHYLSGGVLIPAYESVVRAAYDDPTKNRPLITITEDEYNKIFVDLMNSPTSLSPADVEDLKSWLKTADVSLIPAEVPFKETMVLVAMELLSRGKLAGIKTPTDLLRLAVGLSNGDISLAEKCKFTNFSRKRRRLLLASLNKMKNPVLEMQTRRSQWISLGEKIHPSEARMKNLYPNAANAFDVLRNSYVPTFASKVENSEFKETLKLLVSRPGEFARRLDSLLRKNPDCSSEIVSAFHSVAKNVSPALLLQLMKHFSIERNENRVFFPKGNEAKVFVSDKCVDEIEPSVKKQIVSIISNALTGVYAGRDWMGNVYVDPALKDYIVPFSQRSASKALHTVSRGSRIPLTGNTFRAFIAWENIMVEQRGQKFEKRVDIDLSMVFLSEDFKIAGTIAYFDLRNSVACHSGDFVNAPIGIGASEFIDVDVAKALAKGFRYVALSVNSFCNIPFVEMPICYMGWMERTNVHSGEVYEPKSVKMKVDLSCKSTMCVPCVIDLQEKKVIWTDLVGGGNQFSRVNNVHERAGSLTDVVKSIVQTQRPNIYDLITMNASARGVLVDKDQADMVFSVDEGITPFDMEKIMSYI